MLWSPTGPTVQVTTAPTPFANSNNLGGVARIVNIDAAPQSFTLGGVAVANTAGIRLAIGQDIIVAYGPDVTHAISSNATGVWITPGIGRP